MSGWTVCVSRILVKVGGSGKGEVELVVDISLEPRTAIRLSEVKLLSAVAKSVNPVS